jgi:hypothetical protein
VIDVATTIFAFFMMNVALNVIFMLRREFTDGILETNDIFLTLQLYIFYVAHIVLLCCNSTLDGKFLIRLAALAMPFARLCFRADMVTAELTLNMYGDNQHKSPCIT